MDTYYIWGPIQGGLDRCAIVVKLNDVELLVFDGMYKWTESYNSLGSGISHEKLNRINAKHKLVLDRDYMSTFFTSIR
jgi:hypothetical protein